MSQNNEEKLNISITFMNIILKYFKLIYTMIEKHEFTMIKYLKHFKIILGSNIVNFQITFIIIKDILIQVEPSRKLARWMTKLLDYDVDSHVTKVNKYQGLDKYLANI